MSGKKARRSRIDRERLNQAILDEVARSQGFIDYADFESVASLVELARFHLTEDFANRREWRDAVDQCARVLTSLQLMTALIKGGKGKDFVDVYEFARNAGTARTAAKSRRQ